MWQSCSSECDVHYGLILVQTAIKTIRSRHFWTLSLSFSILSSACSQLRYHPRHGTELRVVRLSGRKVLTELSCSAGETV